MPTSAARLWDGTENSLRTQQYERGLPTRSPRLPDMLLRHKADFLLLLENTNFDYPCLIFYILTVPHAGQALRLPLTNTDGKQKNHTTPPPKPQPRNTTPLRGLLDGQGPRVTYGCIPSSAPRPCEPPVRAPVQPQAAGAASRPPPVTEQGALPDRKSVV